MMLEHNDLKFDSKLNILDSGMDEEQFETTEYKIIDSELLSAAICNSYACNIYKTMGCIYTVEDYGVIIATILKVMCKFYGHSYPFISSNGGVIDSNLGLASDMRCLGKWREGEQTFSVGS
jgi:hypothetical protein